MPKTLIDNFNSQELNDIVQSCTSWRGLCRAIGYNSHSAPVIQRIKNRLIEYNISTEHFTSSHAVVVLDTETDVLIENSSAADKTIRDHYRKGNYSEYKCAICGLPPFW